MLGTVGNRPPRAGSARARAIRRTRLPRAKRALLMRGYLCTARLAIVSLLAARVSATIVTTTVVSHLPWGPRVVYHGAD